MGDILDKIEHYEKQILAEKSFIKSPNSYIYDMTEIEVEGELTEYFKAIVVKNSEFLIDMQNRIAQKEREISGLTPIAPIPQPTPQESIFPPIKEDPKEPTENIKKLISMIEHSLFDDDIKKVIDNLTDEERIRIKLHFLKQLISIKQQIRNSVLLDSAFNISQLQDDLTKAELAIELLGKPKQEEKQTETPEEELSKIILVPNLRTNNSYLFEDISSYLDSRKEIKNAVDKILDGYFLRTKDTKILESYKSQKLYEYKHPNGIRILYVVNNGYIFICSLFFKDKQKSIRITNYYDEAVNRYLSCVDYFKENMSSPDFYIEQAEYTGRINAILDTGITLQKKVGDQYE